MPNLITNNNGVKKIHYIFILYLAMLFLFARSGPLWLMIMQFLLAVEYIVMFIILQKAKPSQISLMSGFLLVVNTLLVRTFFTQNGIHPFGPEPADSEAYMSLSLQYKTRSIGVFLQYLISQDKSVDDFGMLLIGRWAALIGDTETGYRVVLVLFNSIAFALSTRYVYKTACLLLTKTTSLVVMILFGLHQVFLAFSVFGLKENFFMTFIVIALYHLLKYIKNRSTMSLLYGLIFIFTTCLFRFAVAAQLIIAFLMCLLVGKSGRNRLWSIVVIIIAFLFVFFNLDQIIFMLGGHGLQAVLDSSEANTKLGTQQSYLLNFAYSIFGSPALINGEVGFNHVTSFSDLLRSLLTVFMIPGVFYALKRKDVPSLFLFLFWILGAGMLSLVLRGSDSRFAVVYFPSILLLAGVGYENKFAFRRFKAFSIVIITIVFALTLIWNR